MRWRPGWFGRLFLWWEPEEPPWRIAWLPRRVWQGLNDPREVTIWLERYRRKTELVNMGGRSSYSMYFRSTDALWDGRGWTGEDVFWYVWLWIRLTLLIAIPTLILTGWIWSIKLAVESRIS